MRRDELASNGSARQGTSEKPAQATWARRSAQLPPKFPSVSYLPHRKPISQGSFLRPISRGKLGSSILCSNPRSGTVVKFLIATGATLALVTAAAAADIPRRQPVYQTAQVGKMPIGKTPIGKTPIGKYPAGPVVSRY
jgi:hypothetical protein